ncbi:hypothetical protein TSAR_005285 [Trichomalopsis sarcophagae]|uniref:Dynein light chain n=1 Tax=Trichomalopsis sarcophagae TaxID=543379 RepID=A0A232F429_9HYME|nr:hypothetical protein TSAR_005285 [Trichomalopsis sarcophagae]
MPTHIEVVDRTSSEIDQTQIAKYQNSYRLESRNVFKLETVDKLVETIMNENLESFTYEPKEAVKICTETASEIQRKIRALNFDRYKIGVTVSIVEKASQSMDSSMGFLWDKDRDNYTTYSLEGHTYYAICCVYAVYYE